MRAKAEFVDGGRAFKRLRRKTGLTQTELASELGVKIDTVGRWEMGYRRIRPMAWLALKYLAERV